MNKKINYKLPLLFALIAAFGMFVGAKFSNSYQLQQGNVDPRKKIEEVIRLISNAYVDQPDNEKISESAIEAMLKELDPHSVYIPAKDLKESNEQLEGNFEGIGVEFNIISDTIVVVSPISGGPSEQVGIRAGDRIIKIDGKTVAGVNFTNENVFKSLRGAKGTKVQVAIQRSGEKQLLDFTITRGKIPIYSLDASYMATPETGYIKISRFAATTLEEYHDAMNKLKKQGMKNLILDLRGNPGGYLKAAIMLADDYLEKDKLVVYTQGRARPKDIFKATSTGDFERGKLVIMVDEGSASASEIVSGAVQDHDRGIIVGRRSFGKGLVQEPFMLSDGSAVRLTVARYYTPSGRSIQRPYEKGVEDYYEDLNERFKHGELISKDSIKFIDSLKYKTSKNRIVYGGGGIMPDIFVPLDTSENSEYLQKLYGKNVFNEFVFDYMDKNRKSLNANYKDFASFKNKFDINAKILDEFVKYGEKKGIKKDAQGLKTSGEFFRTQIKAMIARQLFKNDAFYELVNEKNETYRKALEVLKDDSFSKMNISF